VPPFCGVHAREQNVGFTCRENGIPSCDGAWDTLDIAARTVVLHRGCEHLNLKATGLHVRDRRVEDAIEVSKLDPVEIDNDDFAKAKARKLLSHHRAGAGYTDDADT
jgi:hypothetical protein